MKLKSYICSMGKFIKLTIYIIAFAISTTLSLAEQARYVPIFPGIDLIKQSPEFSSCGGPSLYTDQVLRSCNTTNIALVRRVNPASGGGATQLHELAVKNELLSHAHSTSTTAQSSAAHLHRHNHPSDYYIYTLHRIRI